MSNFKLTLLIATAMTGTVSGAANAQVLLPAAEIRGAGATTVGDVTVRNLNCIGRPTAGNNKYGTNSGQLLNIEAKVYQPTTPSATNPTFDCRDLDAMGNPVPAGDPVTGNEVQPNFEGRYIGTGSGFGRQMWREFKNNFTGGNINPFGTWSNLQFAFSEAPATASDITTYNASAKPTAGAAIQIPFYVIPISLPYNPVYGYKDFGTAGQVDYKFNVKSTFVAKDRFGNPIGGLRLSKSAYCKIFNGEITNWNDPALKVLNGNQDLRDLADSPTRWANEGVPIRLVGRLDRSGGTDVFTRHLAAACDPFVTLNKFDVAAESLPYDPTSTIDMRGFRSDVRYFPGVTSGLSGTNQSISGAFFDRVGDAVVTSQGAEAPGLFMVADGASGVAEAIEIATGVANGTLKQSAADATVVLNGKFGYVGADFVKPVAGRNLFSASLQQGSGTTYLPPIALNAGKAFGTVLPPQSTASSGAFNVNDTRVNSVTGLPVSRANPLDWTDVLYADPLKTLANPALGYPITGSAFLLTYTCFADNADRLQLALWVGATLGKVTKNSLNTPLSPNTFKGTGNASFGILPQSNTAMVPAGWVNAIAETFLKKSTQKSIFATGPNTGVTVTLGTLNTDPAQVAAAGNGLWIQSKAPLKTTDFDTILTNSESLPNPTCTGGVGA